MKVKLWFLDSISLNKIYTLNLQFFYSKQFIYFLYTYHFITIAFIYGTGKYLSFLLTMI